MAFNPLNLFGGSGNALTQPQAGQNMLANPTAPSAPSFLDRYQNFTHSDRGQAIGDFFSGMAMGQTPQQSLGYGARMIAAGRGDRKKSEQENQNEKWLIGKGMDPEEARFLAGNPVALTSVLKSMMTPDKLPTSVEEFRYGQTHPEYNDWRIQGKRAGATNISDIGNTKGETTYDQTVGKNLGEKTVSIMDSGMQAANKIGTLKLLKQALGNVYQGTGGTSYQSLRRLGQSMGFDVDKVGDGDLAQSISRQMALQLRDPSQGAGMPGALSNSDREFLLSMVPNLSKTPEGNARIIDMMVRLQQRNAEVARMAREYMGQNGGRLDYRFFGDLDNWTKANPLFQSPQDNQERQYLDQQYRSDSTGNGGPSRVRNPTIPGSSAPVRAVNPQTGQRLDLQNGKWVPVQ